MQKVCNANLKLQELDVKIRNRKCTTIIAQVVLLISGLLLTVYYTFQWINSIDGQWTCLYINEWSQEYDWLSISKHLMIYSASFNFISLSAILAGLILIKNWIKDELDGQRRWRCSLDGNFLLYFFMLLLLTLAQAAASIWFSTAD